MKNKASSFGMYPWNFHSILLGGFQFQQIFVAHPIRVFKGCIIWNSVLNCLSLSVHYYFDLLRTSASVVTIFHQTERRTFMLLKSFDSRLPGNIKFPPLGVSTVPFYFPLFLATFDVIADFAVAAGSSCKVLTTSATLTSQVLGLWVNKKIVVSVAMWREIQLG